MMSWSCCPFCSRQVLSTELERHANNHFEDEDLDLDLDLARDNMQLEEESRPNITLGQPEADENTPSSLTSQVRRGELKHGIISLLINCLESEAAKSTSTSFLSGYVDHFQSIDFEDVGWGCGWRNIQMLASHMLSQSQEARAVLFAGDGFVPDIPSLQTWLEVAWDKGFDAPGSLHFHHNIYGKPTWIGTTECAALFRSFGLRARIVDFCSSTRDFKTGGNHGSSVGKRKLTSRIIGPMDRYLNRPDTDSADAGSSNNTKDGCLVKGHQLLADWVWSYFSDNMLTKSGCNQVVVTGKSPLYFQHNGHSRTIVGVQLKNLPNGMQQHILLILDPAHKTEVLESCLSKKAGWQRFIKRGVHTLKKTEYQLCYVDPGIATGVELEKLKTLNSTRLEF